jgi:Spy/CpxP family protein refolding chaperone
VSAALRLLAAGLAATIAVADLDAQPVAGRPAARAAQGAPARAARERLNLMVRERLQLTDAQADRLTAVSARYMRDRDALVRREREVRVALRAEVAAEGQANQERTGRLLDEMLRLQSQRLELVVREQRELATFLSPVQRARFIALQEQMQRAVQQTRQRRAAAGRPGVRPPAP